MTWRGGAAIMLGEIIDVVVGFENNGERGYNVTTLSGSVNNPLEFSYYMQNVRTPLYLSLSVLLSLALCGAQGGVT